MQVIKNVVAGLLLVSGAWLGRPRPRRQRVAGRGEKLGFIALGFILCLCGVLVSHS